MTDLIRRRHHTDCTRSEAVYSPCSAYRYALTRVWNPSAPRAGFVMLNPSTASAETNDPTVERCERRVRALGYGAFRVVNIFAWRATLPRDMRRIADPIGPHNDQAIADCATWANDLILAWGAHGDHMDRGKAVAANLQACGTPLLHLGLTKGGNPRHPLYVAYATTPQRWDPA